MIEEQKGSMSSTLRCVPMIRGKKASPLSGNNLIYIGNGCTFLERETTMYWPIVGKGESLDIHSTALYERRRREHTTINHERTRKRKRICGLDTS